MLIHDVSKRHAANESPRELPLLLYAVASALLPYAAAAVLILVGQTL